ncbi:hypothetical protein GCM10025767_33090 [Thalassotalea piscium]
MPVHKTGILTQNNNGKNKRPTFVTASIGGKFKIKDNNKKRLIEKLRKFIHDSNTLVTYRHNDSPRG